jgi:hypothetical protein
MRRLLLVVYVVGAALLGNASSARACSYEPRSDKQLFAKASTVFVARVVRTEEAMGPSPLGDKPEPLVEATFRVVETLKGRPPGDGKVKSLRWSNGNCSVLLVAGHDYLFFLHDDNYVLLGLGSRPIVLEGVESVTAETKTLLQRLRTLSDRTRQ